MHWQLSAKVNWTLEVLGRRPDGFHELRSWFVALAWGDGLQFEAVAGGQDRAQTASTLELRGPCANGVPTDGNNLLCQAERLWRQAGGQAPALRWVLDKQVPSGAGLGGGSSDAAAALRALQRVATLALSEAQCQEIAAQLGSDVAFFYQGGVAELRAGRGEILLESSPPPSVYLVLALPGIHISTPSVYGALTAAPIPAFDAVTDSQQNRPGASVTFGGREGPYCIPQKSGINGLEAAARKLVPELDDVGRALAQVADFHLSGSGSTFFCACADQQSAARIADQIRPLVPQVILTQPRQCEAAWCKS